MSLKEKIRHAFKVLFTKPSKRQQFPKQPEPPSTSPGIDPSYLEDLLEPAKITHKKDILEKILTSKAFEWIRYSSMMVLFFGDDRPRPVLKLTARQRVKRYNAIHEDKKYTTPEATTAEGRTKSQR
jgi:hypothetical protein